MKTQKISIIIPAYNAEKTIGACLNSLTKVNYPNFEILVVDDGSTDNTAKITKKFPVKLIQLKQNKGAAAARNAGIKKAKGSVIVFTDADCEFEKDWLKKLLKNLKGDIVAVNGVYKTLNKESSLARFVGHDMTFRFNRMPELTTNLGTFNCAILKKTLNEVKGFNENLKSIAWEDTELGLRIAQNNKMFLDKNCFVYHHHPSKLKDYIRKQAIRSQGQIVLRKQGLVNDNYVDINTKLQIPLTALLLFSLIFIPITYLSSYVFSFSLLGITISNFSFLRYITQFENFFFLISAIPTILLRNIAWLYGAFKGFIS